MTALETDRDGDGPSLPVDLRLVGLTTIRGRDLRAPERDFWADEAAFLDRMHDTWAGLDEAAWHLPSAAPSDAGGPPWSLAEHVGHIADWQELAIEYKGRAAETGRWPADSDCDDGDFDTYNERRLEPWARCRATRSSAGWPRPDHSCWRWPVSSHPRPSAATTHGAGST